MLTKALAIPLALLLLAAGCTGSQAPPGPSGAAGPLAEGGGALLLSVTDDELSPVPGATVGIPSIPVETLTDAQGRALLQGLPPGEHQVFVTRLGYEAATLKTEIREGETLERALTLEALAVEVPRLERIPFTGRFECAFTFLDLQWRSCDDQRLVWPNSDNSERFDKPLNVTHIVAELRWQAASAGTGQNLDFSIMQGKPDRQGCQWYANDYGPSPLKLVVEVGVQYVNAHSAAATGCDDVVIDPKDRDLMVKVHSSPTYVAGEATVGVTYGQKYDGYVSLFYNMPVPEAYTAFTDG